MWRAHQLSLCPSSMLTEVPIRVAILYLGDSILIENAINKRARVCPRLEPWLAINMLASSFLDWCWNMSHPNGALQTVAADGLMTEHRPYGLTHDSSYLEGTFLLCIIQVFFFVVFCFWLFLQEALGCQVGQLLGVSIGWSGGAQSHSGTGCYVFLCPLHVTFGSLRPTFL